MSNPNFHVAIIGAGLSGLALALALDKQGIACTLYEARDAPLNTGGGIMLTPNGLKVLQGIGVYEGLLDTAYSFDKAFLQLGPTGEIVESFPYGSVEKYGMDALRAFRYAVLESLLAKVREKEISIQFNCRFSHIVSESDKEVTWQFADGSKSSASILVGTDGIHSTVREYVAPGVKPTFGGYVILVAAIPTAQLGLPAKDLENLNNAKNKHPLPSGIIVPQLGAFVSAPQTKSGDELMITVMRQYPKEPERWTPIDNDKDLLRSMFRENVDKFPEVVQKAVSNISDKQLRIWPAYTIPLLENWSSSKAMGDGKGRVVIMGDSAHACPPSSGQGVNMAFEDVYLFAGVLGKLKEAPDSQSLQRALHGWQSFRQERVDGILRINKQMEIRRLPAATKAEQGIDSDSESLKASLDEEYHNLFKINFEEAVNECLRRGNDLMK